MASVRKTIGVGVLAAAAVILAGISGTVGWRPMIGPRARALTAMRVEASPARLERGTYLVESGAVGCLMCHSELTADAQGHLALADGMALAGRTWAPDGTAFLTAPNLTPDPDSGIGSRTDDELARAIREGISHDGRALFPIMPYEKMRALSDEDLASVIVYLRAQRPVKRQLPPTAIPFPLNRLINSVPQPITAPVTPDLSTPEKRGHYLTTIAACGDCHTPMDERGMRLPGLDFAGGFQLQFTGTQTTWAANITPGVNGIPYYTEELFIETIRTGRVRERELSTIMPTLLYRHMTDDDLKAIFAYLKTLTPVDHYVDNTLPPTLCPKCGLQHGGGERNRKTP